MILPFTSTASNVAVLNATRPAFVWRYLKTTVRTAAESVIQLNIIDRATLVAIPFITRDNPTSSPGTEGIATAGTNCPCKLRVGGIVA